MSLSTRYSAEPLFPGARPWGGAITHDNTSSHGLGNNPIPGPGNPHSPPPPLHLHPSGMAHPFELPLEKTIEM